LSYFGIIPVGLPGIYSYYTSMSIAENKVIEGNGQIPQQDELYEVLKAFAKNDPDKTGSRILTD
jgi:hypothetical protein